MSLSSGESTYDIQSGVTDYGKISKGWDSFMYPIYDAVNNSFSLYGYGYPSSYIFPGTNFEVFNYTINTYDEEGNVEMNIEKNFHVIYDDGEIVSTLPVGAGWYDSVRMFYIEGELYLMGTNYSDDNYKEKDGSNYIIILKYEGVGESTINVDDNDDISISLTVPIIKWSNLTNVPIYDFGFNKIGDNSFHSYDPDISVYTNGLMIDVVRKQLFYYVGETWIFDIEEKRWKFMTPNYIPQEGCFYWIIESGNQNYICIKNEVVYEYDVQKNRFYHHDIKNNDCDAMMDGFTRDPFYFYDMNSNKIIIANGGNSWGGVCAYDFSGNLMTYISSHNFIDLWGYWNEGDYFMYWYQGYDNKTESHYFNVWELDYGRDPYSDRRAYAYLKFDLNIGEGDTEDDEGNTTETITQIDTVTETENNVETVTQIDTVTETENNVETVEFTETYNVTIANTTEIITETVLQDAYFPSLYTMSILLLIPLIIRKYKTN